MFPSLKTILGVKNRVAEPENLKTVPGSGSDILFEYGSGSGSGSSSGSGSYTCIYIYIYVYVYVYIFVNDTYAYT